MSNILSSVIEQTTKTPVPPTAAPVLPSIVDKEGGVRLISDQLGVGIKLVKAGQTTDEVTGRLIVWNDSVKLVSGDKVLKLTALQADYIRRAFNNPDVAAELEKRKTAELSKLMAELHGQ